MPLSWDSHRGIQGTDLLPGAAATPPAGHPSAPGNHSRAKLATERLTYATHLPEDTHPTFHTTGRSHVHKTLPTRGNRRNWLQRDVRADRRLGFPVKSSVPWLSVPTTFSRPLHTRTPCTHPLPLLILVTRPKQSRPCHGPSASDAEGTDPSESDAEGTDPSESDPEGTDPSESDEDGSDPSGSDPEGKDPSESDAEGKGVLSHSHAAGTRAWPRWAATLPALSRARVWAASPAGLGC